MAQTLDALVVELKADIRGLVSGFQTATSNVKAFRRTADDSTRIRFSTDLNDLRSGLDDAQARVAALRKNSSRDRVLDVQADVRSLAGQLQAASADVARFGSRADRAAVVHLRAEMGSLQGQLATATSEIDRFSRAGSAAMTGLRGAFVAVGGAWGALRIGQSLFQAGAQMEGLTSRMIAATGTAEDAAETIAYFRRESDRLGLSFSDTANNSVIFLTNLVKAGVPLEEARRIYIRFAEAGKALGLSNEKLDRTFYALGQTANIGKLRWEELGGQLGDVLPGAIDAAARAMGVGKDKLEEMIRAGEVKGIPFIKNFSLAIREGLDESVAKASKSAQSNLNRVNNSLENLKVTVAEGGFMFALSESFKAVNKAVSTPALRDGLTIIGKVIGGVVIFVSQAIAGLAMMIQKLVDLAAKAKQLLTQIPGGGKGDPAPRVNPDRPSSGGELQRMSFIPEMSLQSAQLGNSSGGQTFDGEKALTLQELFAREQEYRDNTISAETDFWAARAALQKESLSASQSGLEGFLGMRLRTIQQLGQDEIGTQAANFRTTLQQAAQHNKTFFMVEKAAAIARALISARESVVSAFNWGMRLGGPPLAAAFAGAAAAAQAVNIGAIASASFGGSGGGGGGSVSSTSTGANQPADELGRPIQSRQIYITLQGSNRLSLTKVEVRDLIEQLGDAFKDGSRLAGVTVQ